MESIYSELDANERTKYEERKLRLKALQGNRNINNIMDCEEDSRNTVVLPVVILVQ